MPSVESTVLHTSDCSLTDASCPHCAALAVCNQIKPQRASVCASAASEIMECVGSNERVGDFGCIAIASLDSH